MILPMAIDDIIAQIDAEIAQLQQAKSLLTAAPPLRPKKLAAETPVSKSTKKKRNLSPEGRARIAEAVKRRWATQKAKVKQGSKA
jgi:hypothetical protein